MNSNDSRLVSELMAGEEVGLASEHRFSFSSQHTSNLPRILKALNLSLAVTSYQCSRLITIRTQDGEHLDTRFTEFSQPMGICADEDRFTIGTANEVIDFRRSDALLEAIKSGAMDNTDGLSKKVLEKQQSELEKLLEQRDKELVRVKRADALYLQRGTITTGMINIHDIAWGDEGLWVVNSAFSCLSTLSPMHSFIARWKPEFISELGPEDRCHLNGMAMLDGRPRYVTTFNMENNRDSWSDGRIDYGTLIDIDTNELLVEGMILPHSPKCHDGFVYVCESGFGHVWKVDPKTKEKTLVVSLPGFTRGLYFYDQLMFVGTSRLRKRNNKNPIPLRDLHEETQAGIWVINLATNQQIGHITFDGDIDQIYDVAILPNSTMPEFITKDNPLSRHLYDFTEALL